MSLYESLNNFFVNNIEELGFIFISLIYIFFYRYIFIIAERIFRGVTFSLFENKPTIMEVIGFVDSFVIFVLTLVLVIPLFKKILNSYIEPLLNTQYLTVIVIVFFSLSYLYYILVYRKHIQQG